MEFCWKVLICKTFNSLTSLNNWWKNHSEVLGERQQEVFETKTRHLDRMSSLSRSHSWRARWTRIPRSPRTLSWSWCRTSAQPPPATRGRRASRRGRPQPAGDTRGTRPVQRGRRSPGSKVCGFLGRDHCSTGGTSSLWRSVWNSWKAGGLHDCIYRKVLSWLHCRTCTSRTELLYWKCQNLDPIGDFLCYRDWDNSRCLERLFPIQTWAAYSDYSPSEGTFQIQTLFWRPSRISQRDDQL